MDIPAIPVNQAIRAMLALRERRVPLVLVAIVVLAGFPGIRACQGTRGIQVQPERARQASAVILEPPVSPAIQGYLALADIPAFRGAQDIQARRDLVDIRELVYLVFLGTRALLDSLGIAVRRGSRGSQVRHSQRREWMSHPRLAAHKRLRTD